MSLVHLIAYLIAATLLLSGTGNVTGSLLSDKAFLTELDVGSVDVPETAAGGVCEIRTDTGNIAISVA